MEQLVWCIISGIITLALAVIVMSIVFRFVPRSMITISAYSYKDSLIVSVRVYGEKCVYIRKIELMGEKGVVAHGCNLVLVRVGGRYVNYDGSIEVPAGDVLRLYYSGSECTHVTGIVIESSAGEKACTVIPLSVNR